MKNVLSQLIGRNLMTNYDMFNDVKDVALRARNRAIVMANIFEDNAEGNNINGRGASLLFKYYGGIPATEKAVTFEAFKENMTLRGYKYGG